MRSIRLKTCTLLVFVSFITIYVVMYMLPDRNNQPQLTQYQHQHHHRDENIIPFFNKPHEPRLVKQNTDFKLPIRWKQDNVFMSEVMDVFTGNEKGFNVTRVPGMLYHDGQFLVFCEARARLADNGKMAIVSKRGLLQPDNSVQWEESKIVVQVAGLRTSNPCPVYDRMRNTVILVFLAVDPRIGEKYLMKMGQHQVTVAVVKSRDFGKTWSDPIDITGTTIDTIQNPPVAMYAPGPGHGIQLESGRILIAGNHYQKDWLGIAGPRSLLNNSDYSNVIYSDDGGDNWHMGGIVPSSRDLAGQKIITNEAQVAELDNGVVVMAMRTLMSRQPRAQAFSYDGGITFQKAEVHTSLIEPGYKESYGFLIPKNTPGCQGSILSFPAPASNYGNQKWVLFSNPASKTTRKYMSVRLSYDSCKTWSEPWTIYPWYSGYSDLTYLGIDQGVPSLPSFMRVERCQKPRK
uniref:Sialidase-3-like n=1 Tax=Saccoglossus kowalevskii TaxID=10224 RepID=A0ABM0MAU2_SACKO|nr:PREDICTED: sialidase-3-like [Saccoglossus kowalevskii]